MYGQVCRRFDYQSYIVSLDAELQALDAWFAGRMGSG